MTNEELELQALEAELKALEEAEQKPAPVKTRKRRSKAAPKLEIVPDPEPVVEPPAPAAPTPPAPVAAPMPEPAVSHAPPVIRKRKSIRPAKSQGDSSRGIRRRF